jgi:hypothetical protein
MLKRLGVRHLAEVIGLGVMARLKAPLPVNRCNWSRPAGTAPIGAAAFQSTSVKDFTVRLPVNDALQAARLHQARQEV